MTFSILVQDAETGEYIWVDTSNRKIRENYYKWWHTTEKNIRTLFSQAGVDYATFATGEDYVRPLVNLFKRR